MRPIILRIENNHVAFFLSSNNFPISCEHFIFMIDDMNFDFAYLCNVHPNGTVHYDIDRIFLFDITLFN